LIISFLHATVGSTQQMFRFLDNCYNSFLNLSFFYIDATDIANPYMTLPGGAALFFLLMKLSGGAALLFFSHAAFLPFLSVKVVHVVFTLF